MRVSTSTKASMLACGSCRPRIHTTSVRDGSTVSGQPPRPEAPEQPKMGLFQTPARNDSTPRASIASKLTPSIPAAPLFFLASSYAAPSVSSLHTWTYRPQNRQAVSAFALRYRLRLRSCRSMGAFVISPLPPVLSEPVLNSGVPLLQRHYPPSWLLRTPPPPSRLRPTSRVRRL